MTREDFFDADVSRVLDLCMQIKKFRTLHSGRWSDLNYNSQSEAEFAYVCIIANFTAMINFFYLNK